MNSPLFSIIIPAYNSEKTIRKCLDSVVSQTVRDFEVIVVNDGSTDGTQEICEWYEATYSCIKLLNKSNGGVSSARNAGLDLASGSWITFVDSDDWVYPHWLKNFVDAFKEDVDLLVQGFESTTPLSEDIHKANGIAHCGGIMEVVERLWYNDVLGYLWCKAFKNSIIKENDMSFNESFNYHEDEDFILRYSLLCSNATAVESPGYFYYVPHWNKYDIHNRYDLFKSKWISVKKLFKSDSKRIVSSYMNDYVYNALVEIGVSKHILKRRELILDLRRSLRKSLLKSQIYVITKIIIWFDFTGILSVLIVSLHLKVNESRFHA